MKRLEDHVTEQLHIKVRSRAGYSGWETGQGQPHSCGAIRWPEACRQARARRWKWRDRKPSQGSTGQLQALHNPSRAFLRPGS